MAIPRALLDLEERHEKRALTLRILGGIFFIEAFIVCEWIWMGLRSGSALWLWATIGLGLIGMICFGAAEREHRKAIDMVSKEITERPIAYESEHRPAA
jgi:UDP-N-acetylmuramyl pentapeptide phosphotransferase/UDP-N-acetylglucosamine-1-phosphate transferase